MNQLSERVYEMANKSPPTMSKVNVSDKVRPT